MATSTYTVQQRATIIYRTVVDIFDWDKSSDCVTPFELALKQLEGVDTTGTLCVPGAGIGTYVLAALQKGFSPESITAIEFDEKYFELGSSMFSRFGVNYILADFLTWNPNMEFDVIVGNPPYQGGSFGKAVYKSLWPLFWKKSLELAKDDGYVSLITPLTWCSPTTDLSKRDAIDGKVRLWDVFNSYRSVADVTSVKAFFPGVGSTFSLVNVDKSGSSGLSFTDGYSPSLGFYPLSGPDVVSKELSKSGNIADTFSFKRTDEEWKVSIVSSRTVKEINVEVLEWDQDPVTKLHPSLYGYIYCATREQAEYVRERMLECRDILNKHGRYHGFVCYQILGMISLPKLSFSKTK
jgi:hypothetical protein